MNISIQRHFDPCEHCQEKIINTDERLMHISRIHNLSRKSDSTDSVCLHLAACVVDFRTDYSGVVRKMFTF